MAELITSDVTGKTYDTRAVCRIINPMQMALYLKHEVELLDVYPSIDYESGRPIIVYIVSREQTKDLYDAWCRHELT